MIHTTLAIVIVMYVSRARHRGANQLRAKIIITLFRCALNTEMKEENKISLEVLINQPLPQQPEAVAKICYFCVSSIKGLISSENLE